MIILKNVCFYFTFAFTATNAVLKSIHWKPGDKILVNNHSYGAVLKLAKFMSDEIDGKSGLLRLTSVLSRA